MLCGSQGITNFNFKGRNWFVNHRLADEMFKPLVLHGDPIYINQVKANTAKTAITTAMY